MRLVVILAAAALLFGLPAARIDESPAFARTAVSARRASRRSCRGCAPTPSAPGIRAATLERVFPTLEYSARTITLDRAQPGGTAGSTATPPFAPYRAHQLTPELIARGRARYAEYVSRLNDISRRYGVPAPILVAIWGKETGYGTIMGDFDLLNSLASLAYEGRRRQLFTDEFIATLRLMERGFPREELRGSWAGAAGQSQFLPSVYLRLAVDGDGDGRADIWRSSLDALASIANYLRSAGWRPGLTWGPRSMSPTISTALRSPIASEPRAARRSSPAQPLAERRRMAPPRHRQRPSRQCARHPVRARRPRRHRLPSDQQLPGDPRL